MTFKDQQPEFVEYHKTKKYDQLSHKLIYSDPVLRNKLVVQNQKLVSFVLNKMFSARGRKQRTLDPDLREELTQEGSLGLISAVEGFDPTRGFKFSTYCMYWLEQSINSFLLHKQPTIDVPTHIRTAKNKVMNTLKEQGLPQKEIYNKEALDFGISKKMLKSVKAAMCSKCVTSIYEPFVSASIDNLYRPTSLIDIIPDDREDSHQDIKLDKQTIIDTFRKVLKENLTEKERCVLLLRYDVVGSVPYLKKGTK